MGSSLVSHGELRISGNLIMVGAVLTIMVACQGGVLSGITCGEVESGVAPCINYLSSGGPVPAACCKGVQGLNSAAKTTSDRQTTCNCLKSAVARISGLQPALFAGLPGKCGVNLPYTITPNIDCSKIK